MSEVNELSGAIDDRVIAAKAINSQDANGMPQTSSMYYDIKLFSCSGLLSDYTSGSLV